MTPKSNERPKYLVRGTFRFRLLHIGRAQWTARVFYHHRWLAVVYPQRSTRIKEPSMKRLIEYLEYTYGK